MIEAMKQWLEALEFFVQDYPQFASVRDHEAIASLHQAIAEAEKQEPVAWVNPVLEHQAEEAECVAMCLNDRGVPTMIGGKSLSLWGRVEHYANSKGKA